jgi:hypothetical protein
MPRKRYKSYFKAIYHAFGTLATPAAETESMGLPADAQLSWFLQSPSILFNPDETTYFRHRDLAILTVQPGQENNASFYRDFAKTHASATQTATQLYRRAVMVNSQHQWTLDNFVN